MKSIFSPATHEELRKLILYSNATCDLDHADHLPTSLVKSCLENVLLDPITNITNMSIQLGDFPEMPNVTLLIQAVFKKFVLKAKFSKKLDLFQILVSYLKF